MRCSICGGHLTNQRCDDCGMIFPPEDRYTLHHTEDPNCPSHVEPGQKARPVSLAADYARHRRKRTAPPAVPAAYQANLPEQQFRQAQGLPDSRPDYCAGLGRDLFDDQLRQYQLRQYEISWFHCLLSLLFSEACSHGMSLKIQVCFLFSANETKSPPSTIKNALRAFAISLGNTA